VQRHKSNGKLKPCSHGRRDRNAGRLCDAGVTEAMLRVAAGLVNDDTNQREVMANWQYVMIVLVMAIL